MTLSDFQILYRNSCIAPNWWTNMRISKWGEISSHKDKRHWRHVQDQMQGNSCFGDQHYFGLHGNRHLVWSKQSPCCRNNFHKPLQTCFLKLPSVFAQTQAMSFSRDWLCAVNSTRFLSLKGCFRDSSIAKDELWCRSSDFPGDAPFLTKQPLGCSMQRAADFSNLHQQQRKASQGSKST